MSIGKLKIWTDKDKEYLRESWGNINKRIIAKNLKRSVNSIERMATTMKLKMTDEQYENMTGKIRWNSNRDDILRETYNKESKEFILDRLGVTNWDSVRKRAQGMGLAEPNLDWNDTRKDYLRESWGNIPVATIAKHLGTTENSILIMAHKIGLRNQLINTGLGYNVADFSEITGISKTKIYGWIEEGLIKPKKFKIKNSYRYILNVRNTFNFLNDNPDKYTLKNSSKENLKLILNDIDIPKNIRENILNKFEKDKVSKDRHVVNNWTVKEEIKLKRMLMEEGLTVKETVLKMNRTRDSIRGKMRLLGITSKDIKCNKIGQSGRC